MSIKAFELINVIDKIDETISCLEASGNDLYVGCEDGRIIHYAVEERSDSNDKTVYSYTEICQRFLNTKKPIEQLKATSALTRLLVLCDGNLLLLDSDVLSSITSGPKVKNVLAFCVNENPNISDPFTLQFCAGKKRSLLICFLHEDRVTLSREINTSEAAVNMAMDGNFVCVAGITQYCVYNVETGKSQDLFPCNPQLNYPHIKRISKEEFLVVGPGNLGMLVTAAGTSERPPIQWNDGICSISYYHPYVLTITPRFIYIYSLIDQQNKQTLSLAGGSLIGNFDGQLYIATDSSIHCLMPQPWTAQVMDLLDNECVDESLELIKHNAGAGMTDEKYLRFSQNVFQRVGFIKFLHEEYEEAQHFFLDGKLDIRELLCLYPGLLGSTNFTRSQPPLHNLADVFQAFHGDKNKVEQAKEFLINFLIHIRSSREPNPYASELDNALIKLYSEAGKYESLLLFLESGDIACSLEECIDWLKPKDQFVAMAKLYRIFGEVEKCLSILRKLLLEEYVDTAFRGISELIDVIISCPDASLTWRYADFVLERDTSDGVRLFTQASARLDPDHVLKFLVKHPTARVDYLHFLVYDKKIEVEHYHTELVLHYLEKVLAKEPAISSKSDSSERNQLQELLKTSQYYNPKILLSKLDGTDLLLEMSYVYGKLHLHDKALSLLVHDLRDFPAAEQYCVQHSQGLPKPERSKIFLTLLKLYLRPGGGPDAAEVAPALDLLSVHSGDLDLKEVLQVLPSNWSVSVAQQYLRAAFRDSLHEARMKRIQHNLIKCDNIQQKYIFQKICNDVGPISLSSNRICYACGKSFQSCEFAFYPNGVITHRECAKNPYVCPLTGTIFKAVSAPMKGEKEPMGGI